MKLRMLSFYIKKPQKYKDNNDSWKTLNSGDVTFIELGKILRDGKNCRVCINSTTIKDTSKVKRHISSLEEMDVTERVKWFLDNYPDINITYLLDELIGELGSTNSKFNIVTTGFVNLEWNS